MREAADLSGALYELGHHEAGKLAGCTNAKNFADHSYSLFSPSNPYDVNRSILVDYTDSLFQQFGFVLRGKSLCFLHELHLLLLIEFRGGVVRVAAGCACR